MRKMGTYLGLVIVLFIMTWLTACGTAVTERREIKSCVLVNETTTSTDGAFVILYASIQSKEEITTTYYLYIKGVEGFRLQKINSANLEIVETDDVDPSIKGIFSDDGRINEYMDYIAYVPKGTLTQEYSATITDAKVPESD